MTAELGNLEVEREEIIVQCFEIGHLLQISQPCSRQSELLPSLFQGWLPLGSISSTSTSVWRKALYPVDTDHLVRISIQVCFHISNFTKWFLSMVNILL